MKSFVVALAALAALVPAGAQAESSAGRETVSVEVQYGDLNLQSPEGRRKLDRRVASAVRQICDNYGSRDLAQFMEIRRCVNEAKKGNDAIVQRLVDGGAAAAGQG